MFIAFYNTWSSDIPHWNAAILYSLMIVLNVDVLLAIIGLLKPLNELIDMRYTSLFFLGALIVINYILFIKNRKFEKIANDFNSKDKNQRRKQYITGILISILGYILPIVAIVILVKL